MYLHLLHLKISVWKWTWSLQLDEQPIRGWKSVFNRKERVHFHITIHSSKYDSLHIFQFNSVQFKIYVFEIFCETVKGLNPGVKGLTDGQPVTFATKLTNQVNNQSSTPSTDVIQLTLTLKMTTALVVEMSVTVNNNSPIQDYVHPDDHTQPTYKFFVVNQHCHCNTVRAHSL